MDAQRRKSVYKCEVERQKTESDSELCMCARRIYVKRKKEAEQQGCCMSNTESRKKNKKKKKRK
jgi:hypothetical protein